MGDFLEKLTRGFKFEYIVAKSVTLAVIIVLAAEEYENILMNDVYNTITATLVMFMLVYYVLITHEIRENGKNKKKI